MKCDACGAPVQNGKCTYCGKAFGSAVSSADNMQFSSPSSKPSRKVEVDKDSFVKSTGFCILMLLFFFPVGLYLMWHYKKFNPAVRIIITIFIMIGLFMNLSVLFETTSAMVEQTVMFLC